MCVVALLPREARVDHVTDSRDGDGGFGDVGGDDQFPRVGGNGVEGADLLLGGKGGIKWQHDKRRDYEKMGDLRYVLDRRVWLLCTIPPLSDTPFRFRTGQGGREARDRARGGGVSGRC